MLQEITYGFSIRILTRTNSWNSRNYGLDVDPDGPAAKIGREGLEPNLSSITSRVPIRNSSDFYNYISADGIALTYLDKALDINPKDKDELYHKGVVLDELGNHTGAIEL